MATFADLGLQLNTPSNNQQSAQRVGTFNLNQAGSNDSPMYGSNNGLTLQSGSQGVLNTFLNSPKQVGTFSSTPLTQPAPTPSYSGTGGDAGARGAGYTDQAAYDLAKALEAERAQSESLINEAYGASAGYLDQAEGALRADYPTIQNEINSQYGLNVQQANTGKASTLGTIQEQQISAEQRNQNVLADARRMYDELRRGYQARFGGASSAGQAASEIAAVEQQRNQGKLQQEFGNTMRQIESARTQVEQKFQDQLMQLKLVKDQALTEANRDFQNKLLEIQSSRAANEQAKAQAKLSALQDLRNKVYQINLQNLQFQQTLQAQREQAASSLSAYTDTLGNYGTSAESAQMSFQPEINSNLQTSTGTNNTSTGFLGDISKYVGSILPGKKDDQASW